MTESSVAKRLLNLGLLGFVIALFIGTDYWLRITAVFLLFQTLTSKTGLRCIKCLPRDLCGIILLIRIKWNMRVAFNRNQPLDYYFQHWVNKTPDKPCIIEIETGRTFTFKEVDKLANSYANYFLANGYKKGDIVALFLENGADFYAVWHGFAKLGVITAWINSNLKLDPLAHSINVAECSAVITSSALYPGKFKRKFLRLAISALKSVHEQRLLQRKVKMYLVDQADDQDSAIALQRLLIDTSKPKLTSKVTFKDILCYIYTSGTTGNPKPAIIKHFRYYFIMMAGGCAFGLVDEDRIYVTMPMYHSAAGILGIGQLIIHGCTIVIRKKFSASNFWKDCLKNECTASQYIGEICRYLLAQPPTPEEKQHKMRLMYGNGLRAEIWPQFVKRFRIQKIGEFYGSTEGNSNIINIDNKVGACGFLPIYPGIYKLYPVRLVKIDPETGELLRDKNGLCISCLPGDMGEMVGTIKQTDPLLNFEGYANKNDTKKKIITNVFNKGDMVFTSGDILFWDEYGYLYFKDRRGDTYRWKGENVSTTEIESVLQPIFAIEDATVYGVEIQNREGRAGMIGATIAKDANVEDVLTQLSQRLPEQLATYAIPIFLRICSQVDRTGTFKLKKTTLQKEGFNPTQCGGDSIFYWDQLKRSYLPLSQKIYENIQSGVYNKI